MDKKRTVDLALLLCYPLIAYVLCLFFELNMFLGTVLFFGVPSIHLALRAKEFDKKAFYFSLLVSVPLIVIVDYIGQLTMMWSFPHSIFPHRLLGVITGEIVFWIVLNTFCCIVFYKYFLDHHLVHSSLHNHMRLCISITAGVLFLFSIAFLWFPDSLEIPYFYLLMGVVLMLIPIMIEVAFKPKFLHKFFIVGSYFFYLSFVCEIVALKLDWWRFPGNDFIGWVEVVGVRFPLEELLVWMVWMSMAILSWYKYFEEDNA